MTELQTSPTDTARTPPPCFSRRPVPPFTVLLGPDFAGKSSALAEMAYTCDVVSVDRDVLDPEHGAVQSLKRTLARDVLPHLDTVYSIEVISDPARIQPKGFCLSRMERSRRISSTSVLAADSAVRGVNRDSGAVTL